MLCLSEMLAKQQWPGLCESLQESKVMLLYVASPEDVRTVYKHQRQAFVFLYLEEDRKTWPSWTLPLMYAHKVMYPSVIFLERFFKGNREAIGHLIKQSLDEISSSNYEVLSQIYL